ncbi:S8 family serine peptidase [Winogradskyella rapida]|uniref:S8 family serine peptidase n=1 Tax=Winogradskyella rapida TaxID=549701 RepID=A0ABW3KVA8_9FLAO
MLRTVLVILLVCLSAPTFAQEDAWIYFTDKPNVAASLANPISILTQKAIDRKQNFNIAIDARDVPVNEGYVTTVKTQTDILVLAKSKWFNALHVRGTESAINGLTNLDFVDTVVFANPNLNSSGRPEQQHTDLDIEDITIAFTYGNTQNQVEMIGVDNLHLDDYTGEGVSIAIMDAGFPNADTMGAFQNLRDQGLLLGGYDFVDRTTDIYNSTSSNHGTKVLSTMGGFIQDSFVGTAPNASYYLFRTEDASSENPVEESYWVEAAERADSLGVDIINTSLGYTTYDNANYSYTPADMNGETAFITKGANIAAEKGLLVVVSAGNSGSSSWQTVGAPGDSPNVLSIGAVNADGDYVSFSSQGSAAQIGYQKPDVVARGGNAFVIDEYNSIVQNNGTSFSAPILCGGLAALKQALPNVTPSVLKDLVRQSASQYNAPDQFLGYGIPNLYTAKNLALSVDDFNLEGLRLYPNPVNSDLYLSFPEAQSQIKVVVYNQLGQEVLQETLTETTESLDVSALSAGVYLIQLSTEVGVKTLQFIKTMP